MRWPWTSRARLDDALEQVAHLRAEVLKLTDGLTRLRRAEAGIPEVPREPRRPVEAMPIELDTFINGHHTPQLRDRMRREAWRRYQANETWDAIMKDTIPPEELLRADP